MLYLPIFDWWRGQSSVSTMSIRSVRGNGLSDRRRFPMYNSVAESAIFDINRRFQMINLCGSAFINELTDRNRFIQLFPSSENKM